MRQTTPGLTLAGIAALLLVACGGGGGGGSSSSGGTRPNVAPVANAGLDQSVTSGATVTLNGTSSSDSDGSIASYAWTQTAGSAVTLTGIATSQPTFTAPTVASSTTFTFSLVVTDNAGASSVANTVDIVVNPAVAGNVNVTGTVTFGRVLFATTQQDPDRGLLYGSPVQQPSRGVLVRALNATTQAELARASTSSTGTYSLSVPNNTSIRIEVVARMVSDASPALPRWNIRVQNGDDTAGDTPYTYTDGVAFNSSAGTPHNIAIPTGLTASGTAAATSPRASGPFAILDTVYQGLQTVLGVAPNTNFPNLIVAWGNNASLGTFFSSGSPQFISLLSSLSADTDEFDQHVVAHEFGHYIEFNFSRADNIGGPHTFGEKLDPRVAFGEGFGYAFAGIVLNNTDARDSFSDNGNPGSTGFNIENNPPTSQVGSNTDYGCWCSETSVYSVLWDLYDSAADTNDNIALGFAPLWQVLINEQRITPAYTTIFPFVTALKAARPNDTSAINTLLAAQNINGGDEWGTGETYVPTNVSSNVALPLYTTITRGGGLVTLRTANDAGVDNKLGNHRFLRFTPSISEAVTVSVWTTNSSINPDFTMSRSGTFVLYEDDATSQPEVGTTNVTSGTTYLLDAYDCDNGCPGADGIGGDYDLTVEIN